MYFFTHVSFYICILNNYFQKPNVLKEVRRSKKVISLHYCFQIKFDIQRLLGTSYYKNSLYRKYNVNFILLRANIGMMKIFRFLIFRVIFFALFYLQLKFSKLQTINCQLWLHFPFSTLWLGSLGFFRNVTEWKKNVQILRHLAKSCWSIKTTMKAKLTFWTEALVNV